MNAVPDLRCSESRFRIEIAIISDWQRSCVFRVDNSGRCAQKDFQSLACRVGGLLRSLSALFTGGPL
jgi:hypothetical protein